ncbi:MAG: hypothetical protein CMF52_06845 [Legionellales bacterium]|nr:hypothetical protein [Legionellales bacterium]|tara:strand:- start:839 stop:1114 length:276 start_codon:yes stop_codon:yes gene_type:complete
MSHTARKNRDRYPEVGDLIIAYPSTTKVFMGIVNQVTEYCYDTGYRQKQNVLITWQGEPPDSYSSEYGYSAMNIHNLRSTFKIFREGEEIQ